VVSALDADLRAVLFHLEFSHLTIDQDVDDLFDFLESPNLLGSFDAAGWFLSGHLHHSPNKPVMLSPFSRDCGIRVNSAKHLCTCLRLQHHSTHCRDASPATAGSA